MPPSSSLISSPLMSFSLFSPLISSPLLLSPRLLSSLLLGEGGGERTVRVASEGLRKFRKGFGVCLHGGFHGPRAFGNTPEAKVWPSAGVEVAPGSHQPGPFRALLAAFPSCLFLGDYAKVAGCHVLFGIPLFPASVRFGFSFDNFAGLAINAPNSTPLVEWPHLLSRATPFETPQRTQTERFFSPAFARPATKVRSCWGLELCAGCLAVLAGIGPLRMFTPRSPLNSKPYVLRVLSVRGRGSGSGCGKGRHPRWRGGSMNPVSCSSDSY